MSSLPSTTASSDNEIEWLWMDENGVLRLDDLPPIHPPCPVSDNENEGLVEARAQGPGPNPNSLAQNPTEFNLAGEDVEIDNYNETFCLITRSGRYQDLVTCPVLQLPEGSDIGVRLTRAWGSVSKEDLQHNLTGIYNQLTLTTDFRSRFTNDPEWVLVPELSTLKEISMAALTCSGRRRPNYLNEFPHKLRVYQYIHLKGDVTSILRFKGPRLGNENRSFDLVHFPFPDFHVKSAVHPYHVIADAVPKVKRALEGGSDIPKLPERHRKLINLCRGIYEHWLRQGEEVIGPAQP
ncbi:hypothetical protein RSOLAG1IB_09855 [Rhizoctonia solani AG-1 IB]|uniref:HNH nuclease domain-containing protein n=1 Tax=Thanatephorus cucumeris (strain AG1-IB / isolate 7/3/14) TaxID=1108050 RepID=A0A0B7FYH0_THACB|nr:hypothetical protein RSOLAG1IB_09855 [Rhizoctonia solani AG-1 IB]